jgi:hypothetical protein
MLAARSAGASGVPPLAWAGALAGRVRRFSVHEGLEAEVELDPATQPFLADHRIEGVAVLPGVMGLEVMAETALTAFPHLCVAAFEDVRFHAPFKLYRDQPRTLTVHARFTLDGDDVLADCRLLGERTLHGRDEPEVTLHHRARVRLAREPRSAAAADPRSATHVAGVSAPGEHGAGVAADAIYRVYFHGPAYRVIDHAWRAGTRTFGRLAGALPPGHAPSERPTVAAPRLVELAFQVAGLAEMSASGRMALPMAIDRVELRGGVPDEDGRVVASLEGRADPPLDIDVLDGEGRVRIALRGYRTSPLPGTVELTALAGLGA